MYSLMSMVFMVDCRGGDTSTRVYAILDVNMQRGKKLMDSLLRLLLTNNLESIESQKHLSQPLQSATVISTLSLIALGQGLL